MLTPASFGGKKLEPVSFMKQCPVDGIKKELPDGFPSADKILGSLTNFVQGLLNSAMAGGSLDPKKLINAVGTMDVNSLLSDVKKLAAGECIVDEPYTPPAAPSVADSKPEEKEEESSSVSFGIRAGINMSHTYAEYSSYNSYNGHYSGEGVYDDIFGMQLGVVLDIAVTDLFHIQPGLMYIQKGMNDDNESFTAHHLELPVLLSFKLAVLRLHVGPYGSLCLSGSRVAGCDIDVGLSTGIGFDIGMFYIGMFYDYGLFSVYGDNGYYDIESYNRTLGLNLGVNL
jgi:hypothetical protein